MRRSTGSSATNSRSTRVWWSTVRRSRRVSNTTIAASTAATVKAPESHPSTKPTDTIRAATKAEWALGMPPAETSRNGSSRRLRIE